MPPTHGSVHHPAAALRAARFALATLMCLSGVLGAPATAVASRLSNDRLGAVPLSAGTIPLSSAPDISARAGRLITWDGRSLWSRNAASHRRMASTTKVMTALLVLESCDLTETVRVTYTASHTPYAMGLKTYERRTVRQMLEYLLVASSNDAAAALAIHVSGSVPAFATRMNQRAAQLGLTNTHYVNPHGLDQTGQYTSAADLASLMKPAMQQPEFRRILKLRSVTLPAYRGRPARTLPNTDRLLGSIEGFRGGKTGYTGDARYCFVGNAKRDGVTLTSVILGAPDSASRFKSTRTLLEWGFKHYRIRQLASITQTAGVVPVATNPHETVALRFSESTSAAIFDLAGPVIRQASLPASVAVPVFAGQRLGFVRLIQGTSVISTLPAVARYDRASAEETIALIPVEGFADRTVLARTAESTAVVTPFDTERPVERVIDLPATLNAPVVEGQRLGTVSYFQDGLLIVTVPVISAETVDPPTVLQATATAVKQGIAAITQERP